MRAKSSMLIIDPTRQSSQASRRAGGGIVGICAAILICALGLCLPPPAAAGVTEPSSVASADPAVRADPFPKPDELLPAVAFWRGVFGVWRRSQVVLHDDRHLSLVYEVIDLPEPVGESQTPAQRALVERRRTALQRELRALERAVRSGADLTADQSALMRRITEAGDADILRGASERVRSQRGMRERFQRGLEISGRYDVSFRQVFRDAGLPEDLALLPHVESSFMPQARSAAGAVGMWQFMPSAGRVFLRMDRAVDERYDPVAAARGAARYLAAAHARLGDWALAVTSYNHGVGSMQQARARFGTDFGRIVREYRAPSFGFSSRNFYAEFLAVREIIERVPYYFPDGVNFEPALDLDRLVLERPQSVSRVAARFGVPVAVLKEHNPAWTRAAARSRVALPAGHEVWLPRGTLALANRAGTRRAAVAKVDPQDGPVHVVGKSETLSSIARQHGISVATLQALNGMAADDHIIRVGQTLRVADGGGASDAGRTHIVRAGESPVRIASRYGVRLADLLALNEITHSSRIYPGQRLRIPVPGMD